MVARSEPTPRPLSAPSPELEAIVRRRMLEEFRGRSDHPTRTLRRLAGYSHWRLYLGFLCCVAIALLPIGIGLIIAHFRLARHLRSWPGPYAGALTDGKLRLVYILMAGRGFEEGTKVEVAALGLACLDDAGEPPIEFMALLGERLLKARRSDSDPMDRQLAAIARDPAYRPFRRRQLPTAITDGRAVFALDLPLRRDCLRGDPADTFAIACLVDPRPGGGILPVSASVMAAAFEEYERNSPATPAKGATGRQLSQPEHVSSGRSATTAGATVAKTDGIASITLLRSVPAALTAERVEQVVRMTLGDRARVSLVEGNPRIHGFLIEHGPDIFAIHTSAAPYVAPPGLAAWASGIDDPIVARLAAGHRAFVAVDFIDSAGTAGSLDAVHAILARIAAELLDDRCVLLYSTHLESFVIPEAQTAARLRGRDPMALFLGRQAARMKTGDPSPAESAAEAVRRWPEFLREFGEYPPPQGLFLVKAAFTEGSRTEHMWVKVATIDADTITGELGNRPAFLRGVAQGSTVAVRQADVTDWLYKRHGRAEGSFGDPELRQRLMGGRTSRF